MKAARAIAGRYRRTCQPTVCQRHPRGARGRWEMLRCNRNDMVGVAFFAIVKIQIKGGVACGSSYIGLRTSSSASRRRMRHRAARARLACARGCVHRHSQPMVQDELQHAIQRPGTVDLPRQIQAEATCIHRGGHGLLMPLCTLQHCRLALA